MKKFLSLVLALIMTMSLVTISAGATEYRDLTDKDEIQYEEAVAVLNRIGVITGYDDGSFRPETELTRGAAAKIIVSLLIGPEAASNLPNQTAPYPDVPASHTFAGVISYCKTAKIISGYGDGTFKPGNSLTGFAFAKMLLGALGYNGEIEGFVDTGWTMNVARIGHEVGLFDRLDFDGAGAVNRETACQLALNTLKATMVTYGGNTMVSGAQTLVVKGTQAMYVTSNNREINANINRRVINAANNEMTLEFGEAKFKDLRLEHDKYDPAYDDFGRPSNEWSYKKVTIGTFKLPADFTYTTQVAYREDTVATKEKALGLRGYDTYSTDHTGNYTNWSSPAGGVVGTNSPFEDATQITINGYNARANISTGALYSYDAATVSKKDNAPTLAEIADLTDNGVTVEVYVCPVDADFITNVVVVRTQLMEVKRIGSDYVTLSRISPDSRDPRKEAEKGSTTGLADITGYNAFAVDVDTIDVKDNNYDAYNTLKDLKAGDKIAVIPFTADQGKTWEVGEAYVPETVSGNLVDVGLYMNTSKIDGNATSITIGGTKYVINEWNLDMLSVKKAQINATRKDVTAYLAKDGTVLWATEIGNSDAWMIVGDYYQATNTSGKVVWFAHGWTIGGEEVDVDLGTIRGEAEKYAPGELVHYVLANGGTGEYALEKPNNTGSSSWYSHDGAQITERRLTKKVDNKDEYSGEGIYNVAQFVKNNGIDTKYKIHPANSLIPLEDYTNYVNPTTAAKATGGKIYADEADNSHEWNYRSTTYKDDGVKFIYVNFDPITGNVDYVSVRKDAQTVENKELASYNSAWKNAATNVNANTMNWVVSPAEAYVNKDGNVAAVVIKNEPAAADLSNVVIVGEYVGTETGKNVGAENASAIGNTSQREYRQGPNFDEVKTGTFKNGHNVGDIVVIRSTDENGVMDCKMFNGGVYADRNPDVLTAKGITKLKNAATETSKIAFYVGAKAGNSVTSQGGTDISGTASIMSDKQVEADNLGSLNEFTREEYKGLIKVAGAKWIDLRANRGSNEVQSLSDLLDLDNDTVRIKVLLNANDNTDTFRRAYAIVVMAGSKGTTAPPVVDNSVEFDSSVTALKLNTALEKNNVKVVESWTADGNLDIPAGKTLTVNGNLNMGTYGITFGKDAKLVVNGELKIGKNLGAFANVKANSLTVTDNCTFGGTVNVAGALTVNTGKTLTITGTVSAGSAGGSGNIIVLSTNSLHIAGNVASTLTIQAGDGTAGNNGRVTIGGEMAGTFEDKNVGMSTPTQAIAKIAGVLKMSANAQLTTKDFQPTTVVLDVGAKITLEQGTDNANLTVNDSNGSEIDTGTTEVTITIGVAANIPNVTAGSSVTADAETEAPIETTAPFTAESTLVYNAATWDQAVAKNFKPVAKASPTYTWSQFLADTDGKVNAAHGVTTMPWLLTKFTVATDLVKGSKIKAVVKKGETKVAETEVTVPNGTWVKDTVKTLHWELANNADSDVNSTSLNRGELSGSYTVELTWTVNGAYPDTQTPVTAAAVSYTEPTGATVASNDRRDQAFTVEGNTVKVTQVIDLTREENQKIQFAGMPLVGGAESAWFAKDAGYNGAVIVKITNPENRYKTLKVANSAVPDAKQDSFDANGVTYMIMGVKKTEQTNRWFELTLMPTDGASDAGDVTTMRFTMDYSGATIPEFAAAVPPTGDNTGVSNDQGSSTPSTPATPDSGDQGTTSTPEGTEGGTQE